MSATVGELLWFLELLPSMGIKCDETITLHSDTLSAINIAANPVHHAKTEHVNMDCNFIRDEIIRKMIATEHVSMKSQLADIFTKALGKK